MIQLDTDTLSLAEDFVLGNDKFKIIESPGEIIFYDAERNDGVSITGDFDNNVIKNNILESFRDDYERKGALELKIDDISEYIWNNRTANDGIYRIEGAYLNIPENQNDVWIKSPDEKYSSGLDETLKHTFKNTNTIVKFGLLKYPFVNRENPETAIIFKRDPDGIRLNVDVKGNIEAAKILVDNTIKHFDKEQDMNMIDINNYLKSQIREMHQKVEIKNPHDPTVQLAPSQPEQTIIKELSQSWEKLNCESPVEKKRRTGYFQGVDTSADMLDTYDVAAKELVKSAIKYSDQKHDVKISNITLAKKAGYVQGVCESLLALNSVEGRRIISKPEIDRLSKILLSEMHVTKDMAKKFAYPETYKALEQSIFASQQKLEQTHSIKR